MAPSLQTADTNYRNACNRLTSAIVQLEQYLPSDTHNVSIRNRELPPVKPRDRIGSVPACQACSVELQDLDAGDRAGHVCTHNVARDDDEVEVRSTTNSGGRRERSGVAAISR